MARPAWVNPSTQSSSPVSAVASAMAISAGSSRSLLPLATKCCTSVATKAARTTEIELSGPATAKGSELRIATIAPPTAADKNVTAMP